MTILQSHSSCLSSFIKKRSNHPLRGTLVGFGSIDPFGRLLLCFGEFRVIKKLVVAVPHGHSQLESRHQQVADLLGKNRIYDEERDARKEGGVERRRESRPKL
ncbi:hypothetical protein EVAR_63791_1 [Eumeta japonica]|uniref:Uncharacterized protein n=1 Tax=Eumeta variegata TaxID=151549 RepID=A0A4C1ZJS4_EUMVA|nr:hypothetical protein EVAR_63791_1 [Eumeta japonica]